MSDPWFNANLYGWIPGTLLGVSGGLLGSLTGVLAPQGKARGWILGAYLVVAALGLLFLGLGISALVMGQPYGVWYSLSLTGVIALGVMGPLYFVARKRYQEAEERRMAVKDGVL